METLCLPECCNAAPGTDDSNQGPEVLWRGWSLAVVLLCLQVIMFQRFLWFVYTWTFVCCSSTLGVSFCFSFLVFFFLEGGDWWKSCKWIILWHLYENCVVQYCFVMHQVFGSGDARLLKFNPLTCLLRYICHVRVGLTH